MSLVAAALLLAAGAALALRRRRLAAHRAVPDVATWGCGFAAPTARMQYTGASFAELLLQRFSWAIFARGHAPRVEGPFPREAALHTEVPDTVLDLALLPAARAYAWLATRARLLYLSRIHVQMLLVLATLLAALAWSVVR